MKAAEMRRERAVANPIDMKLDVVVIPVSDVDRAKRFYSDLGWRLDIDYTAGDDFRVIQFTPPGSECSGIFGQLAQPGNDPNQGIMTVPRYLCSACRKGAIT